MGNNNNTLPHVVIVGAGFAGIHAARELAEAPVRVTLIDRNNYHLFQPLLYQVATSGLAPDEIVYPVRPIFRRQKNLTFQMSRVTGVNLAQKQLQHTFGTLDYDYLILAVGGQTNYFGIDSVSKHGFGLKDLADATRLRNHLLKQFEQAMKEHDPEKRREMLTFVVVGGGPTGVECAGAISELVRMVLRKDFPALNLEDVRVILLEATGQLLAAMPKDLGEFTTRVLRKKHVEVRFNTVVSDYDGEKVMLKDGSEIRSRTVIWAAGVRASGILDTLGLEQDRLGRVKVNAFLQVPDHPEVFVVGDAASVAGEDGQYLPMLAPVAMQAGTATARNILRALNGKPLKKFNYRDPGVMATIGRNQAVARIAGLNFKGLIAWGMWVVVHIYQLVGFRNRMAVMLDWAWNYIFYERAVRLIGPA